MENDETAMPLGPQSSMRDILEVYPGAQRALFRKYHIGGCRSCGFQSTETLEEICRRNPPLESAEVWEHIQASHAEDARVLMEPRELAERRTGEPKPVLLDIRSRPEFEAVRIEGSLLMSQEITQQILAMGPDNPLLVIIDHQGEQGLDAAAYFLGHGLKNVRCLRGGIDAWAQEVDSGLRRYQLA